MYQKSLKEGFVVAVVVWHSLQLSELKEGLFFSKLRGEYGLKNSHQSRGWCIAGSCLLST